MDSMQQEKGPGGRPPKFNEARRPITVTLPERALRLLEAVDPDRAKAIVKLAEMATGVGGNPTEPVDVVEIAPGKALIFVRPSRTLKRIPGLRLVEVSPGRILLTIPSGTPVESLEVAILDLLENLPEADAGERPLLDTLRRLLSKQRRGTGVSKAELLFVDV
jgi:hypothetical protein